MRWFRRPGRQRVPASTGPATEPPVIVFVHLPKCGGTSLHDWLAHQVGQDAVSPERHRMPEQLDPERRAAMNAFRVFSGHFDVVDLGNLPTPQIRFTVLRDPARRLVSLYDFWRAHDPAHVEAHDLVGPRIAAERSFEEFVGDPDPRIVHDLDNTMVRTFTGLVRTAAPIEAPDAALADAIALARSFDHVGHVDDLPRTARWLCDQLSLPEDAAQSLARSNVRGDWHEPFLRNVERTIVTPTASDAIEPLVRLDRELIDAIIR